MTAGRWPDASQSAPRALTRGGSKTRLVARVGIAWSPARRGYGTWRHTDVHGVPDADSSRHGVRIAGEAAQYETLRELADAFPIFYAAHCAHESDRATRIGELG